MTDSISPAAVSPNPFDPVDWEAFRALGRRMVDDLTDQLQGLSAGPVWRPMPVEVRDAFRKPVLQGVASPEAIYQDYLSLVEPYAGGNRHPGFMGWVQGAGAPIGALAEMLAAGLNMNCGGRDHVGVALEGQIALWVRQWFGFPDTSAGLFTTGASAANMSAVLAARTTALGEAARRTGVGDAKLCAYASTGAHACVVRAMEMAGLGREALRLIAVDADFRMNLMALRAAIAKDRAAGLTPFLIVGTAGAVDVGAIDDLDALADIARSEGLWLHVDGAFGAMGVHSDRVRPRLSGLERADSIAFDFHKWGQVPYDAGFIIVRDGARLVDTYASPANYLSREPEGMAAGQVWPTDIGADLSRGCRALKTWFVLRACGVEAICQSIDRSLDLAKALARLIEAAPELEQLGPSDLNIVCFRYLGPDADELNRAIVRKMQLGGRVAPSLTRIGGKVAIRAALFNPRTGLADIEALVEAVRLLGGELAGDPG